MKFSLVYELQMPKPWTATSERDTYMQALEQIKLADEMKDAPLEHDGPLLKIPKREVWPKPVHKPHPPLWMAGTSPDTFTVAGKKGLGVLCFQLAADGVALCNQNYRAAIKEAEPVGEFVNENFAALAMSHCGRPKDTVELGVSAAQWFLQKVVEILIGLRESETNSYAYLKDMIDMDHQPKDAKLSDLAQHPFIVAGAPDQCIEKLDDIKALGADQFITFQQMGRLPHERIMESIRLFGEEIIPHFRSRKTPEAAAV